MPHKRHYTLILMMFILFGLSFNIPQVKGVDIYTAHVQWSGYDFSGDNNCGDGYGQTCENKLTIKRTTSSSCSSKSWTSGSTKSNYPWTKHSSANYYQITWSRAGSAPCLTFDVRFEETSAGYATSTHTYTISSGGSYTYRYPDLILGSANGDFTIKYWVTMTGQYD